MRIFDLLGEFKRISLEITHEIIDELLTFPRFSHKYKCENSIFDNEEILYHIKEKNLRLRICSMGSSKSRKTKSLNHEFKNMRFLHEKLIEIKRKKNNFAYFLPLACKVVYKGFIALVTSVPRLENLEKSLENQEKSLENQEKTLENQEKSFEDQIKSLENQEKSFENLEKSLDFDENSLVLGPTKEGHYIFDRKIYEDILFITKSLNLQPHSYRWSLKEDPLPISLSVTMRVFKGNSEFLRKISDFHTMKSPKDLQFLLEKRNSQTKSEEFEHFFLENVADIFPLQIDSHEKGKIIDQNRFRPEFIGNYAKSLSSDVFLNVFNDSEGEKLDFEAFQASEALINKRILKLVIDIRDLKENCPINSENLRDSMHKYGINMRFLGEIARKSHKILGFLEKMALREMVARTIKEIFRNRISELIEKYAKSKSLFEESSLINQSSLENSISFEQSQCLDYELEGLLKEETVNLFNLVFGKGRENEAFWKEIIRKKLMKKYDYFLEIDNFEPFQVQFY